LSESWSCQNPRQRLQIGQGYAIAQGSVLVGGVGLGEGGLRINDLQHCCFAAFVAERREAQAFSGEFRRAAEAAEFVESRIRFGVQRFYFSEKLALRGFV